MQIEGQFDYARIVPGPVGRRRPAIVRRIQDDATIAAIFHPIEARNAPGEYDDLQREKIYIVIYPLRRSVDDNDVVFTFIVTAGGMGMRQERGGESSRRLGSQSDEKIPPIPLRRSRDCDQRQTPSGR